MHTTGSDSYADDKLRPLRECVDLIESAFKVSGTVPTITERASLQKARLNLAKLASAQQTREFTQSESLSEEDQRYSDFFLEAFTTKAFLAEMDALRIAEGESMTESDMLTLAESIRNFGLAASWDDRAIFEESTLSSD